MAYPECTSVSDPIARVRMMSGPSLPLKRVSHAVAVTLLAVDPVAEQGGDVRDPT